jgi:Tfp pilus assembly protein PilZ
MRARASVLRHKRVDVNLEFDSLERLSAYMTDLSRTGAFIRANDPWPVGTRLRLKLTLLVDDPEIFQGLGEVVRVTTRPRGMGISFVELTERSLKLVDRILARKPRRRPSAGPRRRD